MTASFLKPLAESSADLAKLSGVLYLAGLLASLFYYSQFSILSIDFLRPQSVLIGAYIVFIYVCLPCLCAIAASVLASRALFQFLILAGTVWAVGTALVIALNYSIIGSLKVVLTGSVIAAVGLVQWNGQVLRISPFPVNRRVLLIVPLAAFHFALFAFGEIPYYFGGGETLKVEVYTKDEQLLRSRFVRSEKQSPTNKTKTAFEMNLLYESEKYFYFLEPRKSGEHGEYLEGYAAIRVPKDQVIRLDYNTPAWVGVKIGSV